MKTKVRYLNSLNISKYLNHYKTAEPAILEIKNNRIQINGNRINKIIEKVISTEGKTYGGIHFENWIELKYVDDNNTLCTLYLINGEWLGLAALFTGNEKILRILKHNPIT